MKLVHASMSVHRNPRSSFHHCRGSVKLQQGIFSCRKYLEGSFYEYGCPVKLVHATLGVRKAIAKGRHTHGGPGSSCMLVCV